MQWVIWHCREVHILQIHSGNFFISSGSFIRPLIFLKIHGERKCVWHWLATPLICGFNVKYITEFLKAGSTFPFKVFFYPEMNQLARDFCVLISLISLWLQKYINQESIKMWLNTEFKLYLPFLQFNGTVRISLKKNNKNVTVTDRKQTWYSMFYSNGKPQRRLMCEVIVCGVAKHASLGILLTYPY